MVSIVAVVGEKGSGRTGGEQYNARLLQVARQAGFHVSYVTWQGSWLDKLMGLPLLWRMRFFTRSIQLTWKLWRSSGDVLIDIWLAPYVQYWAKQTSRNIIVIVHHLRGALEQNSRIQLAEKMLIQAASSVLTVSESSKRQVLEQREGNISVSIIPPGFARPTLQYEKLEPIKDKVQLLFVGHITRAKGILDVLEAIALLTDKHWFLNVVGSGEAEPETWNKAKEMIEDNELSMQVTMHGRVEDDVLQVLYQQADVFVLPSYWEGYGIVFLEAMSFGLPVISTMAGAISEVVEHESCGLLVEVGDVQALSQALEEVISKPEKRKIWSRNAKVKADKALDWQSIEQCFLAWWQQREVDARQN